MPWHFKKTRGYFLKIDILVILLVIIYTGWIQKEKKLLQTEMDLQSHIPILLHITQVFTSIFICK